jgi:hypothetical protein
MIFDDLSRSKIYLDYIKVSFLDTPKEEQRDRKLVEE